MKYLILLLFAFPVLTFGQSKFKKGDLHPLDLTEARMQSSFDQQYRSGSIDQTINQVLESYSEDRVSYQLVNTSESLAAKHYLYQQYIDEIKVYQSMIKINISKAGKVLSVIENVHPTSEIEADPVFPEKSSKQLVYFFDGNNLKIGTLIKYESAHNVWSERIELESGELAYEKDITMFHHAMDIDTLAKAYIFRPNPIISANTTYGGVYIDNSDNTSTTLDAERVMVDIKVTYDDNDNLFKLENDYVKIVENSFPTETPSTSTTPEFLFDRSEQGFEEVNVIYHITEYQEYLQSLGFTNLVDYQIPVDVHGFNGADNSAFNIGNPSSLTFGEGGVDDAEDAHVVLHEYGHAIMHSAAPFTNSGSQRNALDEAIGDFIASSYSRSINHYDWHKVFSWDGHNEFWNGRVSKTDDHYPDDIQNNLYLDAPMWSASIMQIEENTNRNIASSILFQAAYSFSSNMNMAQAAELVIQADSLLYNGDNYAYVCHIFKDRGMVDTCFVDRPIDIGGIDKDELVATDKAMMTNSEAFFNGTASLTIITPQEKVEYKIYDVKGKEVFSGECENYQITLSPNSLASGSYIIHLKGTNYSESIQFAR